jgi:signal transduction histidine kinase
VRQCSELIDALLLLSRRERQAPTDGETTDVVKVVEQVVDSQRRTSAASRSKCASTSTNRSRCRRRRRLFPSRSATSSATRSSTPAGEVIITVGHGRVSVEDTGPGIAPEDAEKLFERGVRHQGRQGRRTRSRHRAPPVRTLRLEGLARAAAAGRGDGDSGIRAAALAGHRLARNARSGFRLGFA